MKKQQIILATIITIGFSTAFTSCKKPEDGNNANNIQEEVVENFSNIVAANYNDALADAIELQNSIGYFVANPTEARQNEAKNAWLNARETYGQTETFRFMDGPIDDVNGPEGNLNAWPLDENYIDYVYDVVSQTTINEGLISDFDFEITTENLQAVNEAGGETNISMGYHAIEFLLWGQDFNLNPITGAEDYSISGLRSYMDFVGGSLAERRRAYITVTTELLISDLTYLSTAWEEGAWGRIAILNKPTNEALATIMTGMAMLSKGELAGERMFVAVDNQDQEHEHSCFSDNTHRDIYNNALGIKNVYFGNYGSVNGSSIQDLIREENADLEETLTAHINNTWETIEAVDLAAPFDGQLVQETVTGNGPIMTAILALQEQGDRLVEAASELGLTIYADLED